MEGYENSFNIEAFQIGTYKGCPKFRQFQRVESLDPFNPNESIVVRYREYVVMPDGSKAFEESATYIQDSAYLTNWFNTVLPEGVTMGQAIIAAINDKLQSIE